MVDYPGQFGVLLVLLQDGLKLLGGLVEATRIKESYAVLEGCIRSKWVICLTLNHSIKVSGGSSMVPGKGLDPSKIVIYAGTLPCGGLGKNLVILRIHGTKLFEGGPGESQVFAFVSKATLLSEGEG